MKRSLIIMGAVLMLTLVPVTASAKGKPAKPASMGSTCADLVAGGAGWALGSLRPDGSYVAVISNDPAAGGVCMDVIAAAGDWEIGWEIDVPVGTVAGLRVLIKDSHPGDTCWAGEMTRPDPISLITATGLPSSSLNVCSDGVGSWDDPTAEFAVLAMADTRRTRGSDFTITITVRPPED